ncbi:MAG: aldo/keto reductase [Spirochaetales bacterium]
MAACREYGVGIIPYSPLAAGVLAGSLHDDGEGRRLGREFDEQTTRRRNEYLALCKELGIEPRVVALAWLLHNPVVTATIIGPRTMEQLESAVAAVEVSLDQSTLPVSTRFSRALVIRRLRRTLGRTHVRLGLRSCTGGVTCNYTCTHTPWSGQMARSQSTWTKISSSGYARQRGMRAFR